MDLKTYLEDTTQVQLVELIHEAGGTITQGAISQWLNGRVPAERVLLLERATQGRLSRHDLRPDLYPRGY